MPVALVEFAAEYGGERVQIAAGEIVHDCHELVAKFPAKFGPGPVGRAPRKRHSSLARRAAETPRRIELSRAAHDGLRDLAWGHDGDEAAVGLYGHREGDAIVVDDVMRMSDWARRGRNFVEVESGWFSKFEARYITRGLPTRHIGEAHTHIDSAQPSDGDLRGWKGAVRTEIGFHVGLIVAVQHDENDWPFAGDIRGWVTSGGVSTPAVIT
jgi:hypothetical protein